ncbi:MAG TPA: DMT family transporter [Actinomycetota bacterium]|nr:DMT family transporter [Actinomycetota bacterium]
MSSSSAEAAPTRRLDPGFLLFLTPVLWGATFPAAKLGLEVIGVHPFMAWTRLIGFVTILAGIPLVARGQVTRRALRAALLPGLLLGGFIFVAYVLQTEGLARTTATNAGFITGLYVVFTPVLALALFRQPAGLPAWVAVVVSVLGLALLSVPALDDLQVRPGDLLVLLSAVAWAAHVVGVGRLARRHPAAVLSLAQMGAAAGFHLVATIGPGLHPAGAVEVWHLLVVTGVLGSGLAYTLQVMAQREVTAGRAVVILAGESVAAAAFAAVWIGERLAVHQWVGAAIVLLAMAISELGARRAAASRIEPAT